MRAYGLGTRRTLVALLFACKGVSPTEDDALSHVEKYENMLTLTKSTNSSSATMAWVVTIFGTAILY